jgi:hypothetical protein
VAGVVRKFPEFIKTTLEGVTAAVVQGGFAGRVFQLPRELPAKFPSRGLRGLAAYEVLAFSFVSFLLPESLFLLTQLA